MADQVVISETPEGSEHSTRSVIARLTFDYGMLPILLLLCAYYSIVTWAEQHPTGAAAAKPLADFLQSRYGQNAHVFIVTRDTSDDLAFARALRDCLAERHLQVVGSVSGSPQDARRALTGVLEANGQIDVIAADSGTAAWSLFENLRAKYSGLANVTVVQPQSYWWPHFLKASNLMNIANQIAVIAILAVGMTLVIITGGIDLSVGSLIALSAVVATRLIRDLAGGEHASMAAMIVACLIGIGLCAALGAFSGIMIAHFAVPPFIVTLAMMLVASGMAYIVAQGQSVYQVPDSFIWLGRGADLFGIPNAVVLMGVLYLVAHIVMTRLPLGRYVYAVGGNIEAARLSGVHVARVLLFAYMACGALAGLGGIVLASQLKSGSPSYGLMYELYTIAAVVVGGSSLSGGSGKMFGTLIGAFIIAVIQNGMNLTNVESYTQKVVLGLVILFAVMIDQLKNRLRGKH